MYLKLSAKLFVDGAEVEVASFPLNRSKAVAVNIINLENENIIGE